MSNESKLGRIKERSIVEFKTFWIVATFLALMFCAFTTYRRLILTEFGISYLHYGAGLIEALIVAKVILVGQALGAGKRFENRPLLVTAFVKALIYGALVGAFAVLEHCIEGLMHGKDLVGVWRGLVGLGKDEILARTLVVIVAFVPFFAFWEAGRAMGKGSLLAVLLRQPQRPIHAR